MKQQAAARSQQKTEKKNERKEQLSSKYQQTPQHSSKCLFSAAYS